MNLQSDEYVTGCFVLFKEPKHGKFMKKHHTPRSLIYAIMKFSCLQFLFAAWLSGAVTASPSDSFGQTILDERISINIEKRKVKDVLSEIERSVKIKFTYNPQSIAVNEKVTVDYNGEKLSTVLDGFLKPLNIVYELSGDYIILRKQILDSSGLIVEDPNAIGIVFNVTGVVTDDEGNPLPGVNVVIKGTTNGTTTDIEGKYAIGVVDGTETLVFTFIGYAAREIPINNQSVINVSMEADITSLNEIVVIGYGTAERKEITSAAVNVDAKSFNKGNMYNAAQLLQGKVAGLSIVKPGSDPNAGYAIRLRGLSTFGANSSPLIVIDGVIGGSLQTVDPNEIESMDVLKDGSAAAIYGTRGSSGVILITTKKGKKGATGVDFNSMVSFEEIGKTVEIASADRFLEEGGPDLGSKTDWIDEVTRTGVSQTYNIAAYGSAGSSSYRLSMNYREVEGIAIGSGFDQLNTRLNLNHSALNDKLILSSSLGVTVRNADFIPYETMRFALISNPTAPIYINEDPTQGYAEPNTTEFHNPVAIMNETTDDGQYKTMLATLKASYEVVEGLNVSAFYSMQYESDVRSQYFSSKMRWAGSSGLNGRATKFTEDRSNQLFELTGSYKKSFDKLALNVVAGYSGQNFVVSNFSAFNTGFITDDLLYNNLSLGLGINSDLSNLRGFDSYKADSKLASFFGRAMLNYDGKYFLSAAYRKEGSSRFGENNRWGDFYSISGGTDISSMIGVPAIDMLKFRAGYGVTGALPPGYYDYATLLADRGVTTFNDGSSDRLVRLFGYELNSNPDLRWEQKEETNLGVDFGLLSNKITGSVDYYVRKTKDLIFNQPVSQPPNLARTTILNLGDMKSNGLELLLNYNAISKTDFSWTTGITYSTNKTEVVKLNGENQVFFGGNLGPPGLNGITPIKAQIGEPLGLIIAPIYLGLDENGAPDLLPLEDISGDGAINNFDDWPVVGNGLPDFELAWNNSMSYKHFDLAFTFRGSFGHSLVNVNRAYYEVPENSANYNLVVTKYYDSNRTGNEAFNSYYVEKASFFKLDNISLGYNLNFNNSVFKLMRIYVTAQNLFVMTDYTGVDPEVHYTSGGGFTNALFPGLDDRNSYFRSKTYSVGVNIGL